MLLDGQWGFTALESRSCHPWAEKPAAEPRERERLLVADRTHACHSAARGKAFSSPEIPPAKNEQVRSIHLWQHVPIRLSLE